MWPHKKVTRSKIRRTCRPWNGTHLPIHAFGRFSFKYVPTLR